MKKQVMYAIKQYGGGVNYLESMFVTCGTDLLQKFEGHGTRAFDPYDHLYYCITTIMMNLAYGKSSETDVNDICKAVTDLQVFYETSGVYLLLDIIPALRFILPSMKKAYRDMTKVTNNVHEICNRLTKNRQEILSGANPQPRFYIDHFLSLRNKQIVDRKSQQTMLIDDDNVLKYDGC